MPDSPKDDGGLRPEDLDRIQMQDALLEHDRALREATERDASTGDREPMSPDTVHNFETFPPVPDADPAPPTDSGGFLDPTPQQPMSIDTVRDFETFRDSEGNPIETDRSRILDMEFQGEQPSSEAPATPAGRLTDVDEEIASDAFLADGPLTETRAALPPSLQQMTPESVANFETFPPLPENYAPEAAPQDEGIEVMQAPGASGGSIPRTMFAAGAGAVLLGLALVAMLLRGGSGAAPTTTPASTAATTPVAAQAATCTATPVPASAVEAIPQAQSQLVGVHCIGGHWYPVEQFRFETKPPCTTPGRGQESYLVTKSGAAAVAIDDGSPLANPRPGGCGFLTTSEIAAASTRAATLLHASTGGMYPVTVEAYRAFQAKAGGTR